MSTKSLSAIALAAAVAISAAFGVQRAQAAPLSWSPLTLFNGWLAYGSGTRAPAGAIDPNNNMVHLRGAIFAESGKASTRAFRLPAALRPAGTIYIPVDTCEATYGRLIIEKNGNVVVRGSQNAIECFVSLEGVNFSKDGAGIGGDEPTSVGDE